MSAVDRESGAVTLQVLEQRTEEAREARWSGSAACERQGAFEHSSYCSPSSIDLSSVRRSSQVAEFAASQVELASGQPPRNSHSALRHDSHARCAARRLFSNLAAAAALEESAFNRFKSAWYSWLRRFSACSSLAELQYAAATAPGWPHASMASPSRAACPVTIPLGTRTNRSRQSVRRMADWQTIKRRTNRAARADTCQATPRFTKWWDGGEGVRGFGRGLDKVDQLLVLTMAACNLMQLRSLGALRPQGA